LQANADGNLKLRDPLYQRHLRLKADGDGFVQEADYAQAEACYNEAAVLAPDEPGPYIGLGTIFLQAGRLDQAAWAFGFAQRIAPDNAEACCGKAMLQQKRGAFPAAFELYLRCLQFDSDNLVALLGLFQTSCQMGTFVMITRYLEQYLRMHPGDPAVLFCLATLYAREGKLAAAREALLDLLAIEPGKAEAARLLEAVERKLREPAT